MKESTTLSRKCVAEAVGTFILVFFGTGSVHAAVLTGAQQGLWQVAIVWGVAISLAVYQYAIGQATAGSVGKRWEKVLTETRWEKLDDNPARG